MTLLLITEFLAGCAGTASSPTTDTVAFLAGEERRP
jgi:hypothetical protein